MRLDEMIIKANADGKTYYCNGTNLEYSKELGFLEYLEESPTKLAPSKYRIAVFINGWEEKQKRHLTVAEAEKELDCVIDTPDISKLFISAEEPPNDYRTVIAFFDYRSNFFKGYYDGKWNYLRGNDWLPCENPVFWIDPADLIKLLHKE